MPNGISGSGGVDTSELKEIKDSLLAMVKTQQEINNTRVKPQGDDSGLKPIRKSLDTIRDEISEINTSDSELWDTKTIKNSVAKAKEEMEKLRRSTRDFQNEFKDETQVKRFISNFKLLEMYGERFGKDLTSEYQKAFDELMRNIESAFANKKSFYDTGKYLGFTPESIKALIERETKSAKSTIDIDIDYAIDTDIAKIRKAQYDEERRLAIENANEIERAERQKREAMLKTRDTLVDNIKKKLLGMSNSAGDNQFIDIDPESFGLFQKQAGDFLNTLEKMGYETKELEELLARISSKVYVPTGELENARSIIVNSSEEVAKLQQRIDLLEKALVSRGNGTSEFDEINRDLTDAQYKIQSLEEEIYILQSELSHSVNWFDWTRKVEEVEHLKNVVDELNKKIEQLLLDNEILENDNRDFQSMGRTTSSYDEEKSNVEGLSSAYSGLADSEEKLSNEGDRLSKSLDLNNLEKFNGILRLIAKYLGDIRTVLGTVDDNNGFKNIITNIETLLTKLDEVYQKIGNGTYNINVNSSGSYGTAADTVISREREKMMSAYNQVVDAFGDESLMYTEIANTLNVGIDEFKSVYGREAIAGTTGEKNQLNLLRSFFQRFEEYRLKSQEFYEEKNEEIENDLRELSEGNALRVASKINYQNRKNKKDDVYTLKHKDVGIESLSKSQREYRISGLEKQRDYNIQKLNQLNALGGIGEGFLDEDSLNKEIMEVTDNAQKSIDELKTKSNEVLGEINQKLGEIRDTIIEMSKKDIFGEVFEKLNIKLDEIVDKFENIISKVELINDSPIITESQKSDIIDDTNAENTAQNVEQATDAIISEGDAAQDATRKKEEFAKANQLVAESAKDTAETTRLASDGIKSEGTVTQDIDRLTESIISEGNAVEKIISKKEDLANVNNEISKTSNNIVSSARQTSDAIKTEGDTAEETAVKLDKAGSALDRYIRRQRGDASSGNYGFTQAINKVVDKDIHISTDENGVETQTEVMRVNYDKLSKELLKTETDIFKLQQQINNTTNGNTDGLKRNLDILKNTKKTYEDLLNDMVSNPEYEIDESQIKILRDQIDLHKQWLQNIQDTKDSIAQLKTNAESVSLGLDAEIKSRELEDYVEELRELGIYTPKVQQEILRLSNVLSQVGNKRELSDFDKEFRILKSDMSSFVKDGQKNINSIIREQTSAYKNMWSIEKQISKLDPKKNANLISELQTQKQIQENIYNIKTQELEALNQEKAKEQELNVISNIRKNAELEIKNIKASQSDADVKTRFDTIISKYREIKKLNSEIQGLISAGVSSSDNTIITREQSIIALQNEIQAIDQLGFSKEQVIEVNKAFEASEQVVADAQAKQAARGALEQQQIDKTRMSLKQQASQLLNNGKIMRVYGDQIRDFIKELENTGVAKDRLEEIRLELTRIKTDANLTGNTGKTFGQILKQRFTSLGAYIGTFTSFYRIIAGIRQAFSTIKELDTQLVDLRKTTKMNTEELNEFYYSANNIAKQMGVTTSEIISQAAAWSRLNKIGHLCGNI